MIDTYDTEEGARQVMALAPTLRTLGIDISAVRLDSGDLSALPKSVREILDAGGLSDVTIFASGGGWMIPKSPACSRPARPSTVSASAPA